MRASLALSAGLITAAAVWAPAAHADPIDDAFLSALTGVGINLGAPGEAAALGQSVCPMLQEPAGTFASAAASITNTGVSPAMAELATQIAVSVYCPQMMTQLADGQLPNLPQIPGLAAIPGLAGLAGL